MTGRDLVLARWRYGEIALNAVRNEDGLIFWQDRSSLHWRDVIPVIL